MRIGLCTGEFDVAAAGLDYLENSVGGLLCPLESDETFAQRLSKARAASLPIEALNMMFPRDLKTTGPEVDAARLDAFVTTMCRRGGQAGVRIVVFGSGPSRMVPEGFDRAEAAEQLVGGLRRWGPIAQANRMMIVLEPLQLKECNIVNTVREGGDLVRRADHHAIRLLADTYHMACDGEGPDAIRDCGDLIAHVHCADPDGRVPLGFAAGDHRPYFRALKDIGYAGRVSIEAKWTDMRAQLPAALESLRQQIEEA
jgi:sugar phosphate isomerase/epimerase